jgi:hypothetical protein
MPEAGKTSRKAPEKQENVESPHVFNMAEVQARNIATFSEANNILLQTAKAIWENETQLFQTETEEARDSMAALRPGKMPGLMAVDLFEQWHRNSEKAISHLRAINDLVRDCEWRLLSLFAHNVTTKAAE